MFNPNHKDQTMLHDVLRIAEQELLSTIQECKNTNNSEDLASVLDDFDDAAAAFSDAVRGKLEQLHDEEE